jgi:hypothetical protein
MRSEMLNIRETTKYSITLQLDLSEDELVELAAVLGRTTYSVFHQAYMDLYETVTEKDLSDKYEEVAEHL